MTDRSSSAYLSSALLHGSVIALILLVGYTFNRTQPEQPKIFQLVAGEGDNYAATAAPALGSPDGIKLPITAAPPAPAPEPTPPAAVAAPEPVPAPVRAKTPAPTASKTPTNFVRTLVRTENRVAARIAAKIKKAAEAERRKQITLAEYQKEHGAPSAQTAEGIRQGVVGGSTANKTGGAGGKALTREEGSLLDAYFALLKSRLMENLEKPTDVSDALTAEVGFYTGADGSLSQVRITRSSGNAEFDQAVLEAFRRTHSIGPIPSGRGEDDRLVFSMRDEDSAP